MKKKRTHKEFLDAGIRSGHDYLESFLEIQEGELAKGSKKVSPEAIALAHKIMDVIGTDKFVAPSPDGEEVMFEWDINEKGESVGLSSENCDTYIVTITYLSKSPAE